MKYITTNLPLEIKEEYKKWRKVSDYEGNQGWVHESLIKGDRYAIIHQAYNEPIQVYNKPQGKIIGKFGKNNIVKINECLLNWCLVSKSKNTGWVIKKNLWGIYNDEKINIPFYHPLRQIIWKLLN